MKKKLLTLLALLTTIVSGVWADTEVILYDGTSSSATVPGTTEQTNTATGFKYQFSSFKSGLIDVSTWTGTGISAGDYQKAIRYNGGTTVSSNKISMTIPTSYVADIEVVYCTHTGSAVPTSGSYYFSFGSSTEYAKPNGSNGSLWNATISSNYGNLYSATISDVEAGSYILGGSGANCCIAYLKVTLTEITLSAPAITTQPVGKTIQKDATGKTLTVAATPSSGSCAYQWYSSTDADKSSVSSLGTANGAQTATYTIPTGTAGTFYYFCRVSDGGSNTTDSNVAKVYVLDRAAKQTWDFTSVEAEDVKYNTSFWTEASANVQYTHTFEKATNGTIEDNFGNDLANGIILRRDAGTAPVKLNIGYGVCIENTSGFFKVPVTVGKGYKVTYTSSTANKTVGFAIDGASEISGDLTHAVTTAHTETYNFTVIATGTTLTLTNVDGNDGKYTVLMKIEEVTPYAITLDKTDGTVDGSADVIAGMTALNNITAPTWADHVVDGYYVEATLTTQVAEADGTLIADVAGYTDANGKWTADEDKTLYAKWREIETYAVTYDLNGGLYEGNTTAPTQAATAEGASFTIPATEPTKEGSIFTGWLCSADNVVYAAGAEYTMTNVATTFTAQYTVVVGTAIIKATVTATNAATVTGTIGGTADVNLQNGGNDGWKFGGDTHHIGVTLSGTNVFKTGDILNVHITKAADIANTQIILYNSTRSISYETGIVGVVGDNKITLPADFNDQNELYIYRIQDNNKWNAYIDYIEVTRPATLAPAKEYTTLTSAFNLDFTDVDGLKAYIVEDNDASDGVITMTQVNKVPAGTGLVIKKTGSAASYGVPVFDGTGADDVSGNKMEGSATATTHIAANGGYILSNGEFHPALAGDLPAGKAYLKITVTSNAPVMSFGDATAIDEVRSKTEDVRGDFYNLNGQRVAQPTKGLYIVNGRKVIMK